MAALPHNIERHPMLPRTYVGYDRDGYAFRVARVDGGWRAAPSHAAQAKDWRRFEGRTLAIVAHVMSRSGFSPDPDVA